MQPVSTDREQSNSYFHSPKSNVDLKLMFIQNNWFDDDDDRMNLS
jgi:hypothetical protein